MAHTYNPSFWETEIWKIKVQGSRGKKFARPHLHLNQQLGTVACACHHKLHRKLSARRSQFQTNQSNKVCKNLS
jgi:hypothetical protein